MLSFQSDTSLSLLLTLQTPKIHHSRTNLLFFLSSGSRYSEARLSRGNLLDDVDQRSSTEVYCSGNVLPLLLRVLCNTNSNAYSNSLYTPQPSV